MRKIGIHLDHDVVITLKTPAKSCDVGGAQTQLLGTMKNMNFWIFFSESFDKPSGSIRRAIIDDQDFRAAVRGAGQCFENFLSQWTDVLDLVVGRDDD